MVEKLQAKQIKPRLDDLIAEAQTVNNDLAHRLKIIRSWIKTTRPGALTKKSDFPTLCLFITINLFVLTLTIVAPFGVFRSLDHPNFPASHLQFLRHIVRCR